MLVQCYHSHMLGEEFIGMVSVDLQVGTVSLHACPTADSHISNTGIPLNNDKLCRSWS